MEAVDGVEDLLGRGVVPVDNARWDHGVSLAWTALEPQPTVDTFSGAFGSQATVQVAQAATDAEISSP